MFRASPWISYEPQQQFDQQLHFQQPHRVNNADTLPDDHANCSPSPPEPQGHMDAPEISTLREEEEETPPPDAGRLSFSKFRVNLRMPPRGQASAAASSGSAIGPPVGPPSVIRRAPSPPDSDDEEEEDQLIDDDELAIVTETGRAPHSSPASHAVTTGSPASTPSPRKRGGSTRGRQRRGAATGRRGRPGREPPDAAAMMSTFELTKTEQAGSSSTHTSPQSGMPPLPQVAGPSTGDWSSSAPPKPQRKKPGPKKGTTLGPRGPRKNAAKNSQLTSARGTPALDDSLLATDASAFLIPAPPSIPPTPGSDQPPLPPQHLPPITAPDFTIEPAIPIPVYPLPTRSFPVQPPPKIPGGYATTHPLDPRSGPPRKWKLAQREIKGIAGGRWFARSWVGEKEKGASVLRPPPPPSPPSVLSAPSAQDPLPPIDPVPNRALEDVRPNDVARSPVMHADSSPEPEPGPESPRSHPGTNGSPAPSEGTRIGIS